MAVTIFADDLGNLAQTYSGRNTNVAAEVMKTFYHAETYALKERFPARLFQSIRASRNYKTGGLVVALRRRLVSLQNR